MLQDDYLTRMTNSMVSTLLKLIFNIELGKNEKLAFKDNKIESKYQELISLIENGTINEAENILLDELDSENMENYKMALMFYYYLNDKDSDFLEEHNFSKGEITDGLRYVSTAFGYESMAVALLGKGEE